MFRVCAKEDTSNVNIKSYWKISSEKVLYSGTIILKCIIYGRDFYLFTIYYIQWHAYVY